MAENSPLAEVKSHQLPDEVLRSGWWGCFRITPKQPSKASRFGGFQVACPFHRLNDKTDCKKFLSLAGRAFTERSDGCYAAIALVVQRQQAVP